MAESCVERELWRVWFSLWWNHITSFRFCCWDALKSLQCSTSEESHSWALNTLVCGLYCLDGKMGNFFFLPWVLQCCFKDMGIFLSALWDTKPLFFFHCIWCKAFQISERLKDMFYICYYKVWEELELKAHHLQLM